MNRPGQDIYTRTDRALEWDRLRWFLSLEAATERGKDLCLKIEPQCELALVELLLDETSEAASLLAAGSTLPFEAVSDLSRVLPRLQAGASLSGVELVAIMAVLKAARLTRASISLLSKEQFPRLCAFIPALHSLEGIVQKIDESLEEHGEVKHNATPTLSQLMREVQKLHNHIKDELQKIIHSSSLAKVLQEPLYTQRNGRYVLPVVASMRHTIPGIVHDSSQSGLTVYVEPMPVVELANKARLKETEVEREMARILDELSAMSSAHYLEIESSYNACTDLDFIFARARLAQKYAGTRPELSRNKSLRLLGARHPLLILQDLKNASHVVPNDIVFGERQRTLIVTGPNTGGKTVLLKTAGLLSLMVRCGLLLPAANGSSAVMFSQVFADIGDEQSLEQSLSTFSSHMTNIVEITNRADENTLVLLDEIGAGTDPQEGTALARAVLEDLNAAGALTITTTHYGELKSLAYLDPSFLNASLEFDEATLSPTYRLHLGTPGSSKAVSIAQRLGLNAGIISRALAVREHAAVEIQQVIEELQRRLAEIDKQEARAREATDRALCAEAEARALKERMEADSALWRKQGKEKLDSELKSAKETVARIIASLQKEPDMKRAQAAQKELEQIRRELGWLGPDTLREAPQGLEIGMQVRILSLNQKGVIEDLPPDLPSRSEALITVKSGAVRFKVGATDIEPLSGGAQNIKTRAKGRSPALKKTHRMVDSDASVDLFVRVAGNTLDLRGQRVDEGLRNLERFLDTAHLSGVSSVMIIHGHGTGAMKAAVRQYLPQSPYARGFRAGELNEGGDGVTIVKL